MAGLVYFRLAGVAEALEIAPPAGELATFRLGEVEVTLELRRTPEGNESDDCLVVATVSREVVDDAYGAFSAHRDATLAAVAPPADPSGMFTPLPEHEVLWLAYPPESVAALCRDVRSELHGEAARLVQILRWLFNRPWPAQPLGRARLEWSLNGDDWFAKPGGLSSPATFGSEGRELTPDGIKMIERLWQRGDPSEPLARQIFLEAYALSYENPRAALVLAVVAAEVGVKQFAALRSGQESEAWLISKLPSPSLRRLLREYLPFFTDKRARQARSTEASRCRASQGCRRSERHRPSGRRGLRRRGARRGLRCRQRPPLPTRLVRQSRVGIRVPAGRNQGRLQAGIVGFPRG